MSPTQQSLAARKSTLKNNDVKFNKSEHGLKSKFGPYCEIIENLTNSFIIETRDLSPG
jgi:SMC interacting uncharacterized protein involved in chromosome segregation